MENNVIEDIVKTWEETRKEMMEKLQSSLKLAFKTFFEENSTITGLRWKQYTPHWNDGETCYFGVHMDYMDVEIDNEWQEEEFYYDEILNKKYAKEYEAIKTFSKTLMKIPDEVFEDMFGDHVEITATKDGFTTGEYEHD